MVIRLTHEVIIVSGGSNAGRRRRRWPVAMLDLEQGDSDCSSNSREEVTAVDIRPGLPSREWLIILVVGKYVRGDWVLVGALNQSGSRADENSRGIRVPRPVQPHLY